MVYMAPTAPTSLPKEWFNHSKFTFSSNDELGLYDILSHLPCFYVYETKSTSPHQTPAMISWKLANAYEDTHLAESNWWYSFTLTIGESYDGDL